MKNTLKPLPSFPGSGTYSDSNRHRMHEKMDKPSDTPRTDEQELAYEAEDGSTYVHTTFARKLERENNELRKDKEADLRDELNYYKGENLRLTDRNNQLKQAIAALNGKHTNSL